MRKNAAEPFEVFKTLGGDRRSMGWYGRIRLADGTTQQKKLADTEKEARQVMADLQADEDAVARGFVRPDQPKAHALSELLSQWEAHLAAKENSPKHVKQHAQRVKDAVAALHWKTTADFDAHALERHLKALRDKKQIGLATSNHYLRAIRAFCNWLLKHDVILKNLFLKLSYLHETGKKQRRALTPEELAKLLAATGKSRRAFRNLTGKVRALLYEVAASTGLRARELSRLTPQSFQGGTVTLPDTQTKNRQAVSLPVPQALAKKLPKGSDLLFPGSWWQHAAEMIRLDLQAAKVPAAGVDFHSLRVTYITNLARAGVPLQLAQKLARHSTPDLTANVYTKLEQAELRAAVEKAFQ